MGKKNENFIRHDLLYLLKDIFHVFVNGQVRTSALNGVSLEIMRNKLTVLIGPSGSGKTTLLKILSGFLPCSEGKIYFIENYEKKIHELSYFDLNERTEYRKKNIGYVSQESALFPHLSVEDNIKVPLYIKNVDENKFPKLIHQTLEKCNLLHRKSHKISMLSGGEKQRVQIAMALCASPSLIIADEPTANLDSQSACNIFRLFKDLVENENQTVFLVTHDTLINEYADEIIHIRDGKIM